MQDQKTLVQARFGRRVGATIIDVIVVTAMLAFAGIVLANLTGGKIRVANALIVSSPSGPSTTPDKQ